MQRWVVLAGVAGCSGGRVEIIEDLIPTASVAAGQATYESVTGCHNCHQLDGEGTSTFPALTERLPLLSDGEVVVTILYGAAASSPGGLGMPAYGEALDDQAIADLIAYLRSAFDP